MFVRRDAAASLDADHERTRRLVAEVSESGEPGLRVWSPPPHVSFGRRDANDDGFERAREIAAEHGYPTAVRESGGRAVAFAEGTLAVVLATPVEGGQRKRIGDRYERVLDALRAALSDCGVDAERGEPPNSFCPGSHSLSVDGRKVAGLAQRVRQQVAIVAGVLLVDGDAVVDVLADVYDALDVPFDPASVGAVATSGTASDRQRVGDHVVSAVESVANRRA